MKKLLVSLVVVATLAFSGTAHAQKYGHVNAQLIITEMPEYKAAEQELIRFSKEKETELQDMYTRYQQSVQQFQTDMPNLSPEILNSRRNELLEKEQVIQQFQQNADQKIQEKQMLLIQGPEEKLRKAIQKVAADNDYTYIFDASTLLYENGNDISDLVRKELGITGESTSTEK